MTSRRQFVSHLASAAGLAAAGIATNPKLISALERYPHAGDPLKDLAAKALDAAKAAGATYADVRFTLTRSEGYYTEGPGVWGQYENNVHGAVGVRALAGGAWGFAASNVWSADEVARLGREAAVQARTNARGRRHRIELGDEPPVVTGEWKTPVKRDPFSVSLSEKLDVLWALGEVVGRVDVNVNVGGGANLRIRCQEKTFGSSNGSFVTQTLSHIEPSYSVIANDGRRGASLSYERLQPMAGGWEVVTAPALARDIPPVVEEVVRALEAEPVDPDRYDIVCDGYTTARILARTVGVAAELDRVLGYEANAGGTSYLAPPEEMLGKYALGPALLNVVADRSRPGSMATVKWDDEGVVPEEYTVIKDGVLMDYHTTRDIAQRSHGCAASETARGITLCQCPNLTMLPGTADTTFDDLVAGLEKGLVVVGGDVSTDRQQLNGEINAQIVYEVKNGKRTRYIRNAEALFRAPELWKGLQAIGGQRSQVWTGMNGYKGQPGQSYSFGISAVPARFNRVPVTDRSRQA